MRISNNKINTDLLIALYAMLLILLVAHVYSYDKALDQQNEKYQSITQDLKMDLGNQLANTQVFLRSLAQTTQFSHNLGSIDYKELMRPSGVLEETIKLIGKFERVAIGDRPKFLDRKINLELPGYPQKWTMRVLFLLCSLIILGE